MDDKKTEVNEEELGGERRVGLKYLAAALLILALFCLVQGFGYCRVNPAMKRYKARAETIRKRIEKAVDAKATLLAVLTDLEEAKKGNRKLKEEVTRYLTRNRWVLFKDTAALDRLEENEELLSELTSKSGELLSAIQQNEQMDREIEALFRAETASWMSVVSHIDELVKKCSRLRSEVAGIVAAKELSHYHWAFVGALTEKEQFLRCLGDAVNSAFQAEYSYSAALETYAGAYFIWELIEAARYAAESEEWWEQAGRQLEEARSHWDEYLRLIALVCEVPEVLDL